MLNFSHIARYMEETVCAAHQIPGCDLIVMKDHKQLWRHMCGYADYEKKQPVTPDRLYYMYSCTKPLTVTCGMRLVEEGKLNLDAPVSDYLPAFADVFLMKDGQPVPPAHAPTVRHLFTMSAGFDYAGGGDAQARVIRESNGTAGTIDIVNTYVTRPLWFEPGHQYQYSMCHDILAAVIEVVSGMKFADYMKRILFDPLEMTDSTFDETPAVRARLAAQFASDSQGNVSPVRLANDFIFTPNYQSGGAGLITTTADYAKFTDALASGGTGWNGARILKPDTIVLLHTEQLSRFVSVNNFACAAGNGYGYGLGVRTRVDRNEGQRSPIGEFGWDGAAGAYCMMDDVNHLSIAFTMHVLGWPYCVRSDHAVMRDMVYDALGL